MKTYEEEARERIRKINELSARCAWNKFDWQCTEEEQSARKEWRRLMKEQTEAEIAQGL